MRLEERIEIGRQCAYGIGQMIDIDRAYEMWNGIEHLLTKEDREIFICIKKCIGIDAFFIPFSTQDSLIGDSGFIYISGKNQKEKHNEAQLKNLFDSLFDEARKKGDFESLYRVLEKYKDSLSLNKNEKTKNSAHVRLGNNLRYLIYHYWHSIGVFYEEMNKLRTDNNLPKRTIQTIYQVVKGLNGMGDDNKFIIVEMVNEKNKKRGGLKRPMVITDLNLPHDEFLGLFTNPKLVKTLCE